MKNKDLEAPVNTWEHLLAIAQDSLERMDREADDFHRRECMDPERYDDLKQMISEMKANRVEIMRLHRTMIMMYIDYMKTNEQRGIVGVASLMTGGAKC